MPGLRAWPPPAPIMHRQFEDDPPSIEHPLAFVAALAPTVVLLRPLF